MSNHGHGQEKGMRDDWDMEEGQVSKTDGDDSKQKKTRTKAMLDLPGSLIWICKINPEGRFLQIWNMMFVVSCLSAVSVDPLFFYLPIINGDIKCLSMDKRLKIIAYSLRSVTDFIYVLNIILQFTCPYIDEASRKLGRIMVVTDPRQIAKRYFFSPYFVIDVLAILPLPQVLFPIIFSKVRGSKFSDKRKFLNAIVFFQYIPRVLRIYISWMNLTRMARKLARLVWVKAAFNFFLYILASHVLGAFWYLFSIQRETACWHKACEITGCNSTFNCNSLLSDHTFLNDYCPIQTPNTTLFDFGIFLEALQTVTLESTNFPQKLLHCFWWGLQNLSSFGQNLQTSTYFWENFFSVCISIFGLLLFLYFIGNMQTYIQLATERSEEIIQNMKVKEREIDIWIDRNKLPSLMKKKIMPNVQRMLEEKKEVDVQNLLSHLPIELTKEIKRHICLPMLKKVQSLEKEKEYWLRSICESLKPLYYNKDSYIIREGEPLNAMLFITQGSVWCFKAKNGENGEGTSSSPQCIEKGEFYGEELLEWGRVNGSSTPGLLALPISTKTVKTLTKVEAFALAASDTKNLVSRRSEAASKAASIAENFHRRLNKKINKSSSKMAE